MFQLILKFLRRALVIAAGAASLAHASPGQPGTLDATWATSSPLGAGKLITAIGSRNDSASTALLQPDGKIVLAGTCIGVTNYDFCALRYLPNGTLDTSFNGTGTLITPMGSGYASANTALVQPDGKIVLAGNCAGITNSDFCAARYLPNGTLDASFNGTGKLITPVGSSDDYATAALLQPDGKIVLAGNCAGVNYTDFCAARYLPNGTLDTSFNGTGTLITPMGSDYTGTRTALLQPDGKIVLAGYCAGVTNYDFCAARYLPNGTLDASFNGTGKLISPIGSGYDSVTASLLQPDGKIVLAGNCAGITNYDFCAARYLPNGTRDTSFNGTGILITPMGSGYANASTALLQPDGKIVLAGNCAGVTNSDFCAARYLPSGTLDTSFNGSGTLITPVGSSADSATAALLQPDGKIVLTGDCHNGANSYFCAVRYDGGPFGYRNCSLDIDGDNRVLAMTDSLIHARIALGLTGNAVVDGISFPSTATRNTWPLIRDYLVTQCGMPLVQ